ncbi:hypothetical protein Moror_17817 [Moniliophthora roreri MCA 2997]|uniref:Eisosome component PIL1-domain-containing protein n=1 Tax=Moniliophthora roreri (strain MCA 2997) TaxID=1381753 RepID=V2XWY8_MONRO|nr:hypothetical protein Moror_17817 [Moniliophthora roreri MCA 2997]
MFKSAATKLAHNTTIPSLGGNSDLRPLQDLITAEKLVLSSLQKLSADFTKAAESLRTWGMGEGDDLGDVLSASTNLLNYFSNALAQYATHEHSIREHLKAIRTREENLDELKRRRKALHSKADAAEKKLSRMSPEHKNLSLQTDTLNRLREEIRMMDSEIMTEEAALGDFKRSKTRALLGLKFGGLLECCEKGTIAGEFGKLVVMEIPDVVTQPGMARPMYTGQQNVYGLLQEAQHCVGEIAFSTVPAAEPRLPRPPHENRPSDNIHDNVPASAMRSEGGFSGNDGYLPAPQNTGSGHFMDVSDMSTSTFLSGAPSSISPTTASRFSPPPQIPHPSQPPFPQIEQASRSTDDFGASPPQPDSKNLPGGGRFATFPVKTHTSQGSTSAGYQLRDEPPLLHHASTEDDSFSSSIAAALNDGRSSLDGPAPSYTTHQIHTSYGQDPPRSRSPPTIAPPAAMGSPWENAQSPMAPRDLVSGADGKRRAQDDQSDEGGLAYDRSDIETAHQSKHESRHVRFGEISDVDTELRKRHEAERLMLEPINTDVIPDANAPRASPRRVPPPTLSPEEEEKELNAAAAREISRELDALNFSAQGSIRGGRSDDILPSPVRGRNDSFGGPVSPINREPSPLLPPSAPFVNRGPSPRPESLPSSPVVAAPQSPIGQSPLANNPPAVSPYVPDSHRTASPPVSPVRETSSSPISPKAPSPVLPLPTINMPERSSSSFSSLRGGASPYQTPPEFPRSPLGTRSTSSLVDRSPGASPAPPPAGTRTISAAAFRRPAKTGSDAGSIGGGIGGGGLGQGLADTSPLHLKKRLPSSPYPPQRPGSSGNQAPGAGTGRERSDSQMSTQQPVTSSPPHPPPNYSERDADDQFDLSAYTSDPAPGLGSPVRSDFGSLGQMRVANPEDERDYNNHYSLPPGAAPATPGGYRDGRFATNLENELR